MGITRKVVEITAPGAAAVVSETIGIPGAGEVLVASEWGAVSPGSEGLVFRGEVPRDLTLDDSIASLDGASVDSGNTTGVTYPLRYGYACAGRVIRCGAGVDVSRWSGRRVFVFHPHATHLVAAVDDLIPIPDSIDTDAAPLYANAETAVTLVWDADVTFGEAVLVLGQGIVGMLLAAIAVRSGAGLVVASEPDRDRREQAGAFLRDTPAVVCGVEDEVYAAISGYTGRYRGRYEGFDAVFELTGNPKTIDTAVGWTAFGGRVVLGSWYGTRCDALSLGGRFHRGRIDLITSQVSTIPTTLSGRFSRGRRGSITWNTLASLPTGRLARHTISLDDVPRTLANLTGGTELTDGSASSRQPAPWISIDYRKEQ